MPRGGKDKLVAYRVPLNYITPYFDGVYLAVNAIPDAYLVYDAHNCGYHEAERIAGSHDLFSDLLRWDRMNRVVRTNIESREYIMGSDDKLSMKLLQVHERYKPEVILVARSNIVVIAGTDASMVVRDLEKRFEVPLVLIPDHSVEHDYLTRYLSTVAELLELLPFEGEREDKKVVTLAGHLFDRHEGDQIGNIQELTRILEALGVQPGGILLDGSPMKQLRDLPRPDCVVDLASHWNGAERLAGGDSCGSRKRCSALSTSVCCGCCRMVFWRRRRSCPTAAPSGAGTMFGTQFMAAPAWMGLGIVGVMWGYRSRRVIDVLC